MTVTCSEYITLKKYRSDGYYKLCKVIPANYAIQLEKSIFEFCTSYTFKKDIPKEYFIKIYNTKLTGICYNLDQINCPSLIIRIMKKEIIIKDIPDMNYIELNPERWELTIKRIAYAEDKRNNMATCKEYKCRNCGCQESYNYTIQTRSCDEPATVFIICTKCNHRFRL